MKTKITPSIGRVVWFQPAKNADQPERAQPYPALICHVHSDTMINIGFFNEGGTVGSATSVTLLQEGDERPAAGRFAEWMPYQQNQAKKDESVGTASTGPGEVTSALAPHQQRVVDERSELDTKIKALEAFGGTGMFASLDTLENDRLNRQFRIMREYSAVLTERIVAF